MKNSISAKPANKTRRPRILGALLLVATLMLSACGAEVSTVFDLKEGVKGTRTISAAVAKENLTNDLTGGTKALDASIRKHLPEELAYSGLKSDEKNVQVSFTLKFESEQEYNEKIAALLDASGSNTKPVIDIVIEDSAFVSGLSMRENFASRELVGWLSAGLVEDGVVAKSNEGSVFASGGKSEIRFNGKKYESSGELTASGIKDNGFGQIDVQTTVEVDGSYSQAITYLLADGRRAALGKSIEEFFAQAKPENAILDETFDTGSYADGWVLTFKAANLDELNAATNKALGSSKNNYSINEEPAPSNPTLVRTTIEGTIDCAAICSPASKTTNQVFVVPSEWEYASGPTDASQRQEEDGRQSVGVVSKDYRLVFERATPLRSLDVETALGLNGNVTQTFKYAVSAESVKRVGSAFETILAPADGIGSFEVLAGNEETVYKAVVEASDIEEYNSKIQSYLPGARLELMKPEGFSIWPEYAVAQSLPLAESLVQGGVTDEVSTTIKLAPMHKFEKADAAVSGGEVSGGKLTAKGLESSQYLSAVGSGPTLGGLVLLGIMGLVVLLAAVFVFAFRRKIAGTAQRAWGKREAASTAATKLATSVAHSSAAAAAGVAAAASAAATAAAASNRSVLDSVADMDSAYVPGEHSDVFREADLH